MESSKMENMKKMTEASSVHVEIHTKEIRTKKKQWQSQ